MNGTTLLAAAERAELEGDLLGAAAALRQHVAAEPRDLRSRLRLGRLLAAAGEGRAARDALAPLEDLDEIAVELNALLADLDEMEGRLASAADHWERVLADQIDHPLARSRLRALGPADPALPAPGPAAGDGMGATFVEPEGVKAMRYRLLREIGRGASSAVYLARDESLEIEVALKVLHPHLAGHARSDARRRFFDEARTAAALRHPGVVAIYDLDEATRSLTMEYVAGGTLRGRIQGTRPAAPAEAVATARSLLRALSYVHERGIVHGDLKPSNLLLRRPGAVVLADFGIARLADAEARSADAPAGTPLYLAPEQIRGAPSSSFTDLYAAGAILWELMAGRPMRRHADLMSHTALSSPPPALDVDPEAARLAETIRALVAPDPASRLPSAAAALASL